jgi:anaerobic magnesium-protoporphyrin IX monomethyl ester cyclase
MRVLLVRPISGKMPIVIPNISLGYLASFLSVDGNDVKILDCARERLGLKGFKERMREFNPELIGFQMFTCDYSSVKEMARATRAEFPQAVLLAGGPHPSALPGETLDEIPELDFVFFGEAELGFPRLVSWLSGDKKEGLNSIPGLAFREGGEVIRVERGEIQDLTTIPFPRWDLIDPRIYPPAPHGTFTRALPVAPVITSRGCPFACRYCAVHCTNGRKWRKREISDVVDEIEMLIREYGVREIHIEDDNFTLDRKRVFEFCEQLGERRLDISWACPNGVRLDTLDEGLLRAMEDSGCYSLAVGIESCSEKFQHMMRRQISVNVLEEKVRLVAESSRIRMTGFFMLGYPGESRDEIKDTIDFACRLPLHRVQFSNFLPLPGTEVYEELVAQREIDPERINWDDYLDNRIAYSPREVSARDLRGMMRQGFLRFYFRPRIILDLLKEIHSFSQLMVVLRRMKDVFK